jgi:hypothetical protein
MSNQTTQSAYICGYCHEQNHYINYCPKITCRWCAAQGHTDRVCSDKLKGKPKNVAPQPIASKPKSERTPHPKPERNPIECFICKGAHHAKQCKIKCAQCLRAHLTASCEAKKWCAWCRTDEHYVGGCPFLSKHECVACGDKGHLVNNCHSQYIVRQPRWVAPTEEKVLREEDYIFVGKK